jgi:hypothetical protein
MTRPNLPATVQFAGATWTLQTTGGGCTCYEATAIDHRTGDVAGVWIATRRDTPDAPASGDWAEVRLLNDAWDDVSNVSLFVRWLPGSGMVPMTLDNAVGQIRARMSS